MQLLGNPAMNQITGLINTIKGAGNPMAMMQQMAGNNPQMRQVMQLVNQNGGDAKTAFYNLAREKGVDPEQILSQVRGMM